MALVLQPASRESFGEAADRLDARIDESSADDLTRLGEDLFAVLRVLLDDPTVRRHLADPAVPPQARASLVERLFSDKIGRPALDTLSELVSARWSRPSELLDGLEALARRATLGPAEKDGSLDDVEDELFRFGRVLDREPQLNAMLGDRTPTDGRVQLLDDVLDGKVSPVTAKLLEQTVRSIRGRNPDRVAEELSELAAERRDRYVAHVRTPVRLSPEQEERLTETLGRLYGRPISLQIELDEDLLGGLEVRVGDELIDGSVAGRLATARRTLPS